jgi:hypothetical protein
VRDALDELLDVYCDAVTGEREGQEENEFWRAVEGAVAKWGGRKPKRQWPAAPWLSDGGAA